MQITSKRRTDIFQIKEVKFKTVGVWFHHFIVGWTWQVWDLNRPIGLWCKRRTGVGHICHIHLSKLDSHLRGHKLCRLCNRHTRSFPGLGRIFSSLLKRARSAKKGKEKKKKKKKRKKINKPGWGHWRHQNPAQQIAQRESAFCLKSMWAKLPRSPQNTLSLSSQCYRGEGSDPPDCAQTQRVAHQQGCDSNDNK